MDQERGFEGENESREIADILRAYGEEHGFDAETCDEVASLPFSEAFEAAYGYLAQAGLDPDEVLASFIEETKEE